MFPNGWPGRGLLLLRIGTGLLLLRDAARLVLEHNHLPSDAFLGIAALAGVFLMLGLWTPFAGVTLACQEFLLLLAHRGEVRSILLYAVIGLALACLGPGEWSIDALLFGRTRIDFPER